MEKRLMKRIWAVTMGLLLVFVGAFSGVGGIGRVKAAAGEYSVTFNLGNTDVDNAEITFEFIDANNDLIGDSHSLLIGMGNGLTTVTDSGNLPDGVVRINFAVRKAGQGFTRDSSIEINGVAQAISGGIEDGQIFDLTSADEFTVDLTLDNPHAGGGEGGGGDNPPPFGDAIHVIMNFTGTGDGELHTINLYGDVDQSCHFDPDYENPNAPMERDIYWFSPVGYSIVVHAVPGCIIESCTINDVAATIIDGMAVLDNVDLHDDEDNVFNISANITRDPDYCNILWGYDEMRMSEDNYVDPNTGTIEIEKITRDGQVLFSYGGGYYDWDIEEFPLDEENQSSGYRYHANPGNDVNVTIETDGHDVFCWGAECRRGDVVTFKFIPAPGYQLVSATLNNFELAPQEEPCTFNISMQGILHICGVFVETDNQTAVASDTVTAASVEGTGGIGNGTLAASVEDTAIPSDDVITGAMENAEEFIESVASVDICMTQIISKGGDASYAEDNDGYWATDISALTEPVDLQLAVSAEGLAEGETYGVIREHTDNEGTHVDQLDAVYDPTAEMLSFSSDLFSTYTIIRIGENTIDDEGGPIEGDPDDVSDDVIPDEIINVDTEAVQQFKSDMANLLSDYDGLASGLNIGNTVSNDGGQTHTVTTFVTTQGPKCMEAFAIGTPTGFNEAFSFNLLVDGKAVYDSKSGFMVIRIPEYLKKAGRVFALMAVDKNGVPHTYGDLDLNADTLCVQIDFEGYAFEVIYADI